MNEKNDIFSQSQYRHNKKFNREMALVKNYQMMLDHRLSVPKVIQVDETERKTKIFRNSSTYLQKAH